MCASPRTSSADAQQLAHRADVDHGRLEQGVADRAAAQLGGGLVEVRRALAGERVAVGVHPARGQADHRVAGRGGGAREITESSSTSPTQVATRSMPRGGRMPADQLGDHRQLAARDLHARGLRAGLQPTAHRREYVVARLLDGDVVQQGDRVRAHADHVVHVHGDAVDAHCVEAAELLGHDQLGADAVRRQGEPELAREPQHARVVAGGQHGSASRDRCRSCAARPRARRPLGRPVRCRRRRARMRSRPSGPIQPQSVVAAGRDREAADGAPSVAAQRQGHGVVGQRVGPRAHALEHQLHHLARAAFRPRRASATARRRRSMPNISPSRRASTSPSV